MTQEELTMIVELVIQALLTNGKTISQLTAVTNVGDNDCFELSGGKKVAYSTLAGLIINEVGSLVNYQVVDYDDRDEIVTFTYTKSTGVITMKQDGRTEKSITIATATTSRPGLMTATDKTNLTTATNKVISSLSRSRRDSAMDITITFADNTTKYVTIPNASTEYAGLMTAQDKTDLNTTKTLANALNNKLGAINGIATLDSNGRLSEDQTPLNKADIIDGANILDPEQWPTMMLYNIDSSADLTGADCGDVIFVSRSQGNVNVKFLVYINDNNESIQLGAPNPNVIYCHKSTGLLYRWDVETGVFIQISSGGSGGSNVVIEDDYITLQG